MVDKVVEAHGRPAVLSGAAEWSSRPTGPVAATPERLAGLVEAALDRADRVLFTVTPREELDAAAHWQRLGDQAWCGQLRHVVASTSRLSGTDRDFVGDELALALSISPMTGRALVWEYGAIAALPGLVESVETGRLTVRHVKAFMRTVEEVSLTLEQRQAVALIALARYVDQTPGEWTDLVRRLILTVDPRAAARRRDEKTAERRVRFYPQPDEQGGMWLQAPVEQVARAEARLHAEASRLKAAGDPRTMDQIVCDVALALLADGTFAGQPVAPYEVHVPPRCRFWRARTGPRVIRVLTAIPWSLRSPAGGRSPRVPLGSSPSRPPAPRRSPSTRTGTSRALATESRPTPSRPTLCLAGPACRSRLTASSPEPCKP